jgi:transposase InsO family protein
MVESNQWGGGPSWDPARDRDIRIVSDAPDGSAQDRGAEGGARGAGKTPEPGRGPLVDLGLDRDVRIVSDVADEAGKSIAAAVGAASGASPGPTPPPRQNPPYPPGGPAEFTPDDRFRQDELIAIRPDTDRAEPEAPATPTPEAHERRERPPLRGGSQRKQRVLTKDDGDQPPRLAPENLTPTQRLLLLDTWQRSGLPAGDFATLVGVSKHTLYAWKRKFDQEGPGGLIDRPRGGPSGSRLPEVTRRTILMLKQNHPDWGCQRISDMLLRGPALPASPSAVARVLVEAGYELKEEPTRPHPDHVRHFERAQANQLWQTDLFTFVLKRQNRRVYLVAFLDDHSRFVVSYGLHASQSTALVLEVLRAGLASYGAPQEILTDNGTQYVTWRGKSAFTKELEKRGIHQIVARPRHPQTLGKIERFWGTLWRECIDSAVFLDLGDAQRRIGLFIDHYNFQRPHQGIDGLVPADRYFGAAPEVLRTLQARVAVNALELARHGVPKAPLYLTGQVGGQPVSLHAEGERVILTGPAGTRQEIDLAAGRAPAGAGPAEPAPLPEPLCPAAALLSGIPPELEPAPGTSPLDEGLRQVAEALHPEGGPA